MADRVALSTRRGRWASVVGVGALVMLSLAGCTGSASSGSTARPARTTTVTGTIDVHSRTDLVNEHAVEWIRSEQLGV